jgi:hypothetical protein
MKLVKKRNVFLSSAGAVSGDKSHFSLTLPYDFAFDEKMAYKLWLSQVNIRNTFFYITSDNCAYYIALTAPTDPQPAPPDPANLRAPWGTFDLPLGCPSDIDISLAINEQLKRYRGATNIHCLYRFGRLYFTQINKAPDDRGKPLESVVYLYFAKQDSPAHKAFGYSNKDIDTVLLVVPDVAEEEDERARQSDNGGNCPGVLSQPPSLMDVNSVTDVVIKTSLPSDNYILQQSGPSSTNISVQIPIAVPPGGGIIYEDTVGVCAVYELAKSVMNILEVEVVDKNNKKMMPGHDWSFVLTIEQYEDVEKQVLNYLKEQGEENKELIQLSKMSLLQREFLEHK